MSSFIRKVIIHCTLSIIGFLLVLYFIQDRYWNSRTPVIKHKILLNINIDNGPVGIILGTSHTFFGINGKLLNGEWYNLASISQSIGEDLKIIEYADSLKINVNKIILPISYFTNFYNLYENQVYGERIRIFDYQHSYGLDYSGKIDLLSRFYLLTSVSQFISKKENRHKLDDHGNLMRVCEDSTGKFNEIDDIFNSHNYKSRFSSIHPDLIKIMKFCDQNKIELILLVMPFTHEYNNRLDKTKFDEFISLIKKNIKSSNIQFHDERQFFKPDSEPTMFQDPDHLSACGQMIFSKHLNQVINGL